MAETPTIYVIDDDENVRRTLAYMLGSAGFAPRLFPTAEAFLAELASPAAAGCVLSDVRLPGMSGLDLVARLTEGGSAIPVVVMSGAGDIDMAVAAMKLGAVDFLQKPLRSEKTITAVRQAIAGQARKPQPVPDGADHGRIFATLTPRQRDVLKGILVGKLNKTIAHELGISVRTVEGYRAEIMAKTQAESLSALIRLALLARL